VNLYKRKKPVKAVMFSEKEYVLDNSKFPGVYDKALLSELWWNKTAEDGRYYVPNPDSHSFVIGSTPLREGDYILTEESGYVHVIPKEAFEKDYEIMTGSEGLE
jgi:hypothetical protein